MASISEIAAATPDTENPKERQQLPHVFYFGMFFDGTSNNMVDAQTAKQRRGSWSSRQKAHEVQLAAQMPLLWSL